MTRSIQNFSQAGVVYSTQINLQLTSAAPAAEVAALAFGFDRATTASGFGG